MDTRSSLLAELVRHTNILDERKADKEAHEKIQRNIYASICIDFFINVAKDVKINNIDFKEAKALFKAVEGVYAVLERIKKRKQG